MPNKPKAQCKVCNSVNLNYYEHLWYRRKGKIPFSQLEREARTKGESISRKSFANHFTTHYSTSRIQRVLDQGSIDSKVEEAKTDVINILDEIKGNLVGLKALIDKSKTTKNLNEVVAVYREHRLTLQDIERLRNKLSESTVLTKAELYQEIFWACSELCPKCREQFWVKLDERLKLKGFA